MAGQPAATVPLPVYILYAPEFVFVAAAAAADVEVVVDATWLPVDEVSVAADVLPPTATQYASPIYIELHEGGFTAGFHAMKVSTEMPYLEATR